MRKLFAKLLGKKLDPSEQKVIDDIAQFGCHVMFVFDDEGDRPDFAYSIGFPVTVGQPEVIIHGLKRELMHSMLNALCKQCAEGLVLEEGTRIEGLVEGFDCIAKKVTDPEAIKEHFGWAIWYHRSQHNRVLDDVIQVVWPGAQDGLFPWDAGCSEIVIAQQPALYSMSLH
jgi:Domain of unknown function (DUF4262)